MPASLRVTTHALAVTLALAPIPAAAQTTAAAAPRGTIVPGERAVLAGRWVVNFAELARREALDHGPRPAVRPRLFPEFEEEGEPGAGVVGAPAPPLPPPPPTPLVPSPSPGVSFMGLDDIPMVDSSYIVIPPDVEGAVGRTRILEGLNNNYRILDKATGATISTVGTATFWAPTGATLNALTDPRTIYDPYNDRWIVETQTFEASGSILVGVSQTSDPAGAWFLYRFNTGASIDFPIMGFNKNWIVVGINRYSAGGAFQRGITLVMDYPQARAGTGTGTIFTQGSGTHFCSAPCVTYSTTSDTLYVVTHLNSSTATYEVDRITGTSSAPVYTSTSAQTRPGGGWVQPSGNLLPQSAPNSGSSACGATPCPIEAQDAQVRSAPVFRAGSIWYAQTIGLPSGGLTHTAAQWTRLTTPGGGFVEGGRLEDPTATATNGGKWYAYTHIAPNAAGDFMLGFSQFSSAQHPSAGYAMHLESDGAATLRDPLIFHAGEDYYHKTFSTTTGRNRWGDFSTAQVDPDDATLWTVQEYGKARVGTDDGNTGSNSSRWSTWWAAVGSVPPTATIAPGPSLPEGNSGTTPFTFTVNLSSTSSQTVTVNYQTSDGTATVADNDYQAAASFVTIPPGNTSAPITVNVVGDTTCEPDETFHLTLTSATNATIGTATATATILNDDSKTITASAGSGGSISPSGAIQVACFGSQGFTITPNTGNSIADVLVDGVSVGAVGSYAFTNVTADHTIAASFAANQYTLTLTATGKGSVTRSPNQATYSHGTTVTLTPVPAAGWRFTSWSGDTVATDDPLVITMTGNRSYVAAFADTTPPTVTLAAPNGGESWAQGSHQTIQWSAADNEVIARIDLFLSRTGSGGPFDTLAADVPNTGSFDWLVGGNATSNAFVEISARDSAGNAAADTSNAAFAITGPLAVGDAPVTRLELAPVSPNPVRRTARIDFALPVAARVHLGVLDVEGRETAVLADGSYGPGRYHVAWPRGSTVQNAGLYFIRLTVGDRTLVRRAVLIR